MTCSRRACGSSAPILRQVPTSAPKRSTGRCGSPRTGVSSRQSPSSSNSMSTAIPWAGSCTQRRSASGWPSTPTQISRRTPQIEGPFRGPLENLKELSLMRISALSRFALVSVVVALAFVAGAAADTQTENVYVDGQTYAINTGAAVVFDASPGLLEQSSPMYLIGFTVVPGTTGPITLPSGYQPQNNGLPSPVPYHDHVLTGAPGLGTSGTAGDYAAPLRHVWRPFETSPPRERVSGKGRRRPWSSHNVKGGAA